MNISESTRQWHPTSRRHRRGFALIVTLSLMILLTVIAVGLLTLSSLSLRSSSQGSAMQEARANARMALMMAIGDIQKQMGPDTRISANADQIGGSDGSESSTPLEHRQWAGAYQAWQAAVPNSPRPDPQFLQWFVSGDPATLSDRGLADVTSGKSVQLVSSQNPEDRNPVKVPSLPLTSGNGSTGTCAWWVSDLGTKALVSPAKKIPESIADVRADQQSSPAFDLTGASSGAKKPFANLSPTEPRLAKVVSADSLALLAAAPEDTDALFHDFTANSRGLLTNVRKGGFRQDLSMQLERPAAAAPNPVSTALYTISGEKGINLNELWTYYNLCSPTNNIRGLKTRGGATFTTGGTMPSGTPFLQVENSPSNCQLDDSFYFKQPVIVSYQLALSFQTRPVNGVNQLHLVADPIITLWNPLDVPVVVPGASFFTVKYWQIPYDLQISKNGQPFQSYPVAAALSGATNASDGDSNFLSLAVGQLQPMVFKPGEAIKMSQVGATLANSAAGDLHKLGGGKGFNYGGGVAFPVRDRTGATISLAANDRISFKAAANNLTAGATSQDGHSITNGPSHSRHFSLTHHEYYIGADRGTNSTSLGIGGMFIDWDFGNRRLKPAENRGTSDSNDVAGTKPSRERLYANDAANRDIFKPIVGRPLLASILSTKQPFMLLSFNAKTEAGSDTGSRTLARFNPKALHVDFYDLSDQERDMLPYEYTVESLDSWKNRSLEQSPNGSAYFGGGMDAANGTSFVTTHSVPREPLFSLAGFQYSFANGFDIQKPKYGYATLNSREPMLPQIAHAIGNSYASPMIPSTSTESKLSGGRPLADHSYLANQGLWDDWFLSGIAPQTATTFGEPRSQRVVAADFFSGTGSLPVARYHPNLRGKDPADVSSSFFRSAVPSAEAITDIASLIQVDGMFNVNSTSVEAWKSLLGGRKGRPVLTRDTAGRESVKGGDGDTPVAGLFGPTDGVADGSGGDDLSDANQWTGRRTLSDEEIERLARSIVREVRKRGPFLSLADFVNRRVGSDAELARCGAIQSALDSGDTQINSGFESGNRATTAGGNFAFPEAETGAMSQGIPGIVKQADILTPIAPILSARSDTFLIRSYGEKTDKAGKVLARAWCEAVIQRSAGFIDPTDPPEKNYDAISALNKSFGRKFDIVSFRWLNANEV